MPFHTFKKERKWLKMEGKDLLELFWQTFVSNLSEKRLMLEIDIEYKWAVDDQCLESWSFKVFALINILCVHQLEMLFKAAEVFISVLFISETETFLLEIWSKIRWVACDQGAGRLRSLRWGLGNPGLGIVRRRMKKTWNGSTWRRCLWNMNENYGFLKVVIVWVSVQETKDLTKRLVWWKGCVENILFVQVQGGFYFTGPAQKVLKITKSLTKKGKRGQLSLFC